MSYVFDPHAYDQTGVYRGNYYAGPNNLGNSGQTVSVYHVVSGLEIYFMCFLYAYTETFTPEWSGEPVYGRADPIYTYKNTTRQINLTWRLPAATEGEAYENLAKVQKLAQFCYPAYTEANSATTIAQSPLVRLKMMNLIQNNTEQIQDESSAQTLFSSHPSSTGTTAKDSGILGAITSMTINQNIDNFEIGMFEIEGGDGSGATIYSRMIDVTIAFSPIHESTLGWTDGPSPDFYSPAFPYNARMVGDVVGAPPQPQEVASDDTATEQQNQAAVEATVDNLTGRT